PPVSASRPATPPPDLLGPVRLLTSSALSFPDRGAEGPVARRVRLGSASMNRWLATNRVRPDEHSEPANSIRQPSFAEPNDGAATHYGRATPRGRGCRLRDSRAP